MNNSFSITKQSHISLFKKVNTFKNLSDYLYIKITYNNINFQVMDDVFKISILDISFDNEYFNTFIINYETLICINIIDFTKILKNFSKTNIIQFKIINDSNILYIESDINDSIKKFTLSLIEDNTYKWINIDTFNSNNSQISILAKTLQTIISELHVFSDYLTIHKSTNSDILEFIVDEKNNNTYSKYELNNINILNTQDIELSVSLVYLHNFKLLSNFIHANITISNNNPLHINLVDKSINVNYMLAPKVDA